MKKHLSLLLPVLLAAAGCTARADESEPPIGALKPVGSYADIALPLDAFEVTPQQADILLQAHVLLVRECSKRFGLDIRLPYAPTPPTQRETLVGGRYGIFVADYAKTYGYNPPAHLTQPDSREAKQSGWNPSDVEFLVANGTDRFTGAPKTDATVDGVKVPVDGCNGEATRRLQEGGESVDLRLGESLSRQAHQRAERDSRVRRSVSTWSECMKRAGYTYTDQWAPNNRDWPEPPTEEEIATALADVACKREAKLVETWLAVETAYQKGFVEKNAQQLKAAKDGLELRLRNANQLLTGK